MNSLDTGDPLERILRDALRADAERAPQLPMEWTGPTTSRVTDDAIDTAPVALEFDGDQQVEPRQRPAWILVVAAALVAIAVGGVMVVIGDDGPISEVPVDQPTNNVPTTVAQVTEESLQLSDQRVRESAALRIGFVGLPPVGAQPSTPERGTLAFSISQCSTGPALSDGVTVLADGRLIWVLSGRMVQQRLTPEGVELMLSELADSGLLATPHDDGECGYYGHMQVGDRRYGVEFEAALDDPRIARLIDPWSWLPVSAWADSEITAFVPSEYLVSIWNGGAGGTHPSNPAPRLPTAVQEFIRDRGWECQGTDNGTWCYTLFTTDKVRTLAELLDAAGFVAENTGADLEFHDETSIRIGMEPRFPWQSQAE